MSKKSPSLLSAFTGAGGLDLGLECAGFRTVGCIEFDELARKTLQRARPTWSLIEPCEINAVAKSMRPCDLGLRQGELSLLAGGPPCQPFSKAAQWIPGASQGLKDDRARCLSGFLKLIELFLPEVVLIENVPAFAFGKLSAVPRIERKLNEINRKAGTRYSLDFRLLDASHFGVAQRRERAILVANREGKDLTWPKATHFELKVCAWDALADVKIENAPVCVGRWASLLPTIPEGENYQWHTDRGGGEPLFGYRTRFWSFLLKLAKAEPAWTISAQPGPATGPFHWESRPLAIPELLRLQSFPTDWPLAGNFRDQVRQVGNATPPLLAEVVGREIARQFFGKQFPQLPRLSIERRDDLPEPERVHPIPKTFLAYRGTHQPHPGTGKGPRPILTNETT